MTKITKIATTLLFILLISCINYHDNARQNFVKFAKQFKIDYDTYECQNHVHENGYVTCEYSVKKDENNKNSDPIIHRVECSGGGLFNYNEGCVTPKMSVNVDQ